MADVKIQQAVAQMQSVAALARQQPTKVPAETQPTQNDFAGMLRSAVDTVNTLQQDASQKTDAFIRGDDIALTDVMVAGQKSRVAFEATKEVRNRLLEAYQTVSRMQV